MEKKKIRKVENTQIFWVCLVPPHSNSFSAVILFSDKNEKGICIPRNSPSYSNNGYYLLPLS